LDGQKHCKPYQINKNEKKVELFAINPNLEFLQPTNFTIVGMFNNCGSATTLEEARHCNHEQTYYTTILTSLPLFAYEMWTRVHYVRHWKHEVKNFTLKIVLRTKCVNLA